MTRLKSAISGYYDTPMPDNDLYKMIVRQTDFHVNGGYLDSIVGSAYFSKSLFSDTFLNNSHYALYALTSDLSGTVFKSKIRQLRKVSDEGRLQYEDLIVPEICQIKGYQTSCYRVNTNIVAKFNEYGRIGILASPRWPLLGFDADVAFEENGTVYPAKIGMISGDQSIPWTVRYTLNSTHTDHKITETIDRIMISTNNGYEYIDISLPYYKMPETVNTGNWSDLYPEPMKLNYPVKMVYLS